MKNHNDTVLLYWSKELSDSERHKFEAHLINCGSCQETLDELIFLGEKVAGLPLHEAHRDLVSEAMEQATAKRWSFRFFAPQLVFPAAALGTAVIAAFLLIPGGSGTGSVEHSPGVLVAVDDLNLRIAMAKKKVNAIKRASLSTFSIDRTAGAPRRKFSVRFALAKARVRHFGSPQRAVYAGRRITRTTPSTKERFNSLRLRLDKMEQEFKQI